MTDAILVNTDGSCIGNPGPGGYAAIIDACGDRVTVSGGDPSSTNQRMELTAALEALRLINEEIDPTGRESLRITIRSDSQYLCNAFNQGWLANWQRNGWRNAKKRPVENQDLWRDLLSQVRTHRIAWAWVKGHSGDPMNEECDRIANDQARLARSQPGPWNSVGNPRSRPAPQPVPVPAGAPAPFTQDDDLPF